MLVTEGEAYLFSLSGFGHQGARAYKPGFERINALMDAMGHPHASYPVVHIAGTNGKGSTASFVAAMGTALGTRVGLHTSPHLVRINERMRVNGAPAPMSWLDEQVARYRAVFERVGPSFFEATVALSFLYFRDMAVDMAVVEVGLGGRLDSTNIVVPAVTAITNVGYDHMDLLGHTLEAIAREKAGIIKPGVPVVSGITDPGPRSVVAAIARERGAPLYEVSEEVAFTAARSLVPESGLSMTTPTGTYDGVRPGLPGQHQYANLAVAWRIVELFFPEASGSGDTLLRGVYDVKALTGIRGRLDVYSEEPLIMLDVSHNHESLAASVQYMKDALRPRSGQLYVAFGTMRDKDIDRMASVLAAHSARVFIMPIQSERALSPDELQRVLYTAGVNTDTVKGGDGSTLRKQLLDQFDTIAHPNDGLLITGSHHLVAPFATL